MAFCFTLLLCLFSLAHDIVLTEVAVGASSSSLWLEYAGPPVLVSWLSHRWDFSQYSCHHLSLLITNHCTNSGTIQVRKNCSIKVQLENWCRRRMPYIYIYTRIHHWNYQLILGLMKFFQIFPWSFV